jgi:hypothetical protein
MKKFTLALSCMVLAALVFAAPHPDNDRPQYTKGGELVRPDNYRDWVFLSSGFGMNYSPAAGTPDMFSNVFVPQWAYREFVQSGRWPDKTLFVVEERMAQSRGSINKHGNFQTDFVGLGVEVKDSALSEKWAYYTFASNRTAAANPRQACFSCHEQHAAVEHTFVQFYPTLKPLAKKFGTYRQSAENVE